MGNVDVDVTYKVTNQKKTFTIDVIHYKLMFGFSLDNYTAACPSAPRQSYTYGLNFWQGLYSNNGFVSNNKMFLDFIMNHNSSIFGGASKDNFKYIGHTVGDIADQSDFMVYIGHGGQAFNSKGNYLHYSFAPNGNTHTTPCSENDNCNLYTSEAKFGSPTSRLRWVWLYTCNFLNTNDYVSDDDLKQMMNGAHIVMGYATQAYLCSDVSEMFAEQLSDNRYIINSFFIAGDQAESEHATDNHIQKVLYIDETRYETINTSPVRYNYSASDVRIITNGIHDDNTWE